MNENVEEKQHPIDAMGDVELFRELLQFFGGERLAGLFGWVFVAGLISEATHKGNPAALRKEMEARGMTQSGIYRALADLRRFGEHVEGRTESQPVHNHRYTMQIIKRISRLQTA